jgi:hypothetical protein
MPPHHLSSLSRLSPIPKGLNQNGLNHWFLWFKPVVRTEGSGERWFIWFLLKYDSPEVSTYSMDP